MKASRIVVLACLSLVAVASVCPARSLLGKKMYYLNSITNKTGEAKYWFVYLGQLECTLNRKYPGEEMQAVTGNMNLSLLSSGYIEGTGYSAKGKTACTPTMKLKNDKGERTIELDSIDCIFDFGQKVRTISGDAGDLLIDLEGQPKTAIRFALTEYAMVTSSDGERELKKTGDDIPLAAIAFSREGIARAIKGMQSKPKADTAAPAAPGAK